MNTKTFFVGIICTMLIVPQIAFAAWWNPLSWSVWSIFKTTKVQKIEIATTTSITHTATTTKKADANTKKDKQRDGKNSITDSSKKQTTDLAQKMNEPKIETQTTNETSQQTVATSPVIPNKIIYIDVTPTHTSVKIIWQTDKPSESRILISDDGISSKIYNPDLEISTRHSVSIGGLKPDTNYFYEIQITTDGNSYKEKGFFLTLSSPPPIPVVPVATIEITPFTSGGNVDPQNDMVMWRASILVSGKAISLKELRLHQIGAIHQNELANFRFYFDDDVQFGSTVPQLDSSGYIIFSGNVQLDPGRHYLKLLGDIVAGYGSSLSFQLRRSSDIKVIDVESNQPIIPSQFQAVTGGTFNVSCTPPSAC